MLDKIVGYVFDAKEPGSGKTFDWSLVPKLERDGRLLFLAGGIDDKNVIQAIKNLDMDNITPREAYAQLEEFKKMLE